jgi:hypothetical protein
MKNILFVGLAFAASGLWAQDAVQSPPPPPAPPVVKVAPSAAALDTSSRISARLAADITRVIADYTQEIVNINDRVRSGALSNSAAQEKRDSLDEYLAIRLETVQSVAGEWAERNAERAKEAEESAVEEDFASVDSTDGSEDAGIRLGLKDGKLELNMKRKKWKREFDQQAYYFGGGNWFVTDNAASFLDPYSGKGELSTSFVFNYSWLHGRRLFHKQSPLWLRSGVGITSEAYYFKEPVAPYRTQGGFVGDRVGFSDLPLADASIRQNYLNYATLEIPLSLAFNASRKGTKGITVAAGGFGGVRLGRGVHVLQYRDENRDWNLDRTNSSFFMPVFNYGLTAEVGYRGWRVAARYNLNPVFKQTVADETGGVRSASVGVMLAL